ncbi:hypothetical protein BDV96DRAFT_653983 [Lophiotrema nucula]|uniref:Phenazine biosynthesis-like protein n=1 Tax=Lophiotrema nucula TaxID=690887 RepID=A0A6A5YJA1_9PLEO|nr:hypothetical protein BDV96DRAFT_653983 [Lophiotrema nucula]
MSLPFTTLDVFTSKRYVGNPLAVIRVTTATPLTEEQKQKLATEFNLSESVFLYQPDKDGVAVYDIFTPRSRISFAGHPTIGTVCYIANHPHQWHDVLKLKTQAGIVEFTYDQATKMATVEVPQAVYTHKARLPHPLPGRETNPTDSDTVPLVSIVKGMAFNLVPMKTLEALGSVSAGLLPYEKVYAREYLDAGSGWDVGMTGTFYYCDLGVDPDDTPGQRRLLRTRSLGSREDPGTGSASSALCSYLALREGPEKSSGPFEFHLVQGVEMGRRCDLFVKVQRTEDGKGVEKVWLSGTAVEVMDGTVAV